MKSGIKAWPEKERPREKLIRDGVKALSDAELVAILLRNGVKGKDAVALAREILSQTGGLRGLLSQDASTLRRIRGLGWAKIASLLAATEMARRELRERIIGKCILDHPEAVIDYLYRSLRDQKREVFKIIFLDKALRLLDERDLFEGTVDRAAIDPREILRLAFARHAAALVLVHNHPSGRVEPSPEDKEMTQKLAALCESVSLRVLDHLIVGDNVYFSFQEHDLLGGQVK